MKNIIRIFTSDLKNSFLDLMIVIGVIGVFQLLFIREVPPNWWSIVTGLVIVGIGLALFIRGLEIGIFPLGEGLTKHLIQNSSKFWLVLFAFVIGFVTTIAEPTLLVIAEKASIISNGQLDTLTLRLVVALSVGIAIAIGVIRIILGHRIHVYIITGYVLVIFTTIFAPKEIIALAYDSGGVTTSTITVPLIAALGIGLATFLKNRNPMIDGFGLIAFASLTPMIFVQLYGILVYNFGFSGTVSFDTELLASAGDIFSISNSQFGEFFGGVFSVVKSLTPVVLVILFFNYIIAKQKIENLVEKAFGLVLIVAGLYAFIIGLEIGLFPIGEVMASQLIQQGNLVVVYLFAFSIGFATTMAEPALITIARKVEEMSGGSIKQLQLRLFVALGVGLGLFLGAYRIVQGDSIIGYIVTGYILVIILTFFAPRTIIPVAYDSGGVTTSTVTVPLVAALGLGLATNIPGRDPMIDGFGLIAFASLFPIISVLLYGIIHQKMREKGEKSIR